MAIVEQTQFFVYVAGTDVSTRFASRLIKLTVKDNSGETADSATIELDDTGGAIALPQKGAKVTIALGPLEGPVMQVFDGVVDDVKHIYDRGGGRRITVEAKSADTEGKQKEQKRKHWDDKTVGDALFDSAKAADVQISVAPRIAGMKRKYQAQDNESFLHFAERMAKETGGTFKMVGGNRAVILDRNEGQTVGGGSVGSVTVTEGVNLITSNISPILVRPQFKEVIARWYDTKTAKWKEERVQVQGAQRGGETAADVRYSKQDAGESKDAAGSTGKESERDKGAGSIILDGDPRARAEGRCILVGVRPGVDGEYTIDTATHELARGGGYTVNVTVKRPGGGAGEDKRTSGTAKGGGGGGDTTVPHDPIFGQ